METLELTPEVRLALSYGMSELENGGDWSYYASLDGREDEVKTVLEGKEKIWEVLKKSS